MQQSKERADSLMEKQHYPLDYEDSGVIDEDASEESERVEYCRNCGHADYMHNSKNRGICEEIKGISGCGCEDFEKETE